MGFDDDYSERGYVDGFICVSHVKDPHLLERLAHERKPDQACVLCESLICDSLAVAAEEIAQRVDELIGAFNVRAVDILPYDGREGGYQGPTADIDDVLGDLGVWEAFEPDIADLALDLIRNAYADEPLTWVSSSADPDTLHWDWELFADTVKHSTRLVFRPKSTGQPGATHVIDFLTRITDAYLDSGYLLRYWEKGTSIFRGRMVENFDPPRAKKWDASTLGPPPAELAKANAMSPAGISLFYGSLDPQTAIAEIAQSSIHSHAVVGEFRLSTGIHIFDLTNIEDARHINGSMFDDKHRNRVIMRNFLADFIRQVTMPVIPDGREHYEYAPTQVLTEFLRSTTTTAMVGIAFPSSIKPSGTNVVLFYDHSDVTDQPVEPGPDARDGSLTLAPGDIAFYRVTRDTKGEPVPQDSDTSDSQWVT